MNKNNLMQTYRPLPVSFVRGQGVYLFDSNNERYFDAHCGIAVTSLGHAHPAIVKTITEQAAKLIHTSNVYEIETAYTLANTLCEKSRMQEAFFCNSGAEANECAIKLARLYGHTKNIANPCIVVVKGAFHGRTLATLSASSSRKVQAGFEPLVQGFIRAPYNDIAALKAIAQNNTHVVAVMVEPIQGEGGINVPADNYLNELSTICDENDWLLMLDEVQTGMGRTGELFAYQHNNIIPDVLMLAKALGNGVPIGACLAAGKACGLMTPGTHGTTFGGNPLCTAVAQTVLNTICSEGLSENAAKQGKKILTELKTHLAEHPKIKDIRGKGLMLGIECHEPCRELLQKGVDNRILFTVTGADKVLRLLPPLIIADKDVRQIIDKVSEIFL